MRDRYQELFHNEDRDTSDNMELAECCLDLMEAGDFTSRQTQHVRRLLNVIGDQSKYRSRCEMIRSRLQGIEDQGL